MRELSKTLKSFALFWILWMGCVVATKPGKGAAKPGQAKPGHPPGEAPTKPGIYPAELKPKPGIYPAEPKPEPEVMPPIESETGIIPGAGGPPADLDFYVGPITDTITVWTQLCQCDDEGDIPEPPPGPVTIGPVVVTPVGPGGTSSKPVITKPTKTMKPTGPTRPHGSTKSVRPHSTVRPSRNITHHPTKPGPKPTNGPGGPSSSRKPVVPIAQGDPCDKKDDTYPHPKWCNKYYICKMIRQRLYWYLVNCAAGYFDEDNKKCFVGECPYPDREMA